MRKYGSSATDAGTASRNAKCLLQKVLNKIGNIEVSAQQAADAMLGNDSFFSTHKFRYVFIWDVLKRINIIRASERRMNEDVSDGSETEEVDTLDAQPERIVLDGDGNVTALTQFDQYVNRGALLKDLSLYDYVACIKMIRVNKKQGGSIAIEMQANNIDSTMHRRGRRSFKRYYFDMEDSFDDTFAQIVSPIPVIPQIVGHAPPSYPGNRPDETANNETVKRWTLNAKLFVQFYSYMFLPWDSDFDPRDPTMPHLHVLPWDDDTSWDNFCTIVKSWKFQSNEEGDNTMWYKRSTYRILNNMVSNLRQSGSARTLLMKWRSMMADTNEELTCKTVETKKQPSKGSVKDVVIGTDVLADDISMLQELLRNIFGVNDEVTFRQRQNLEKTNVYMQKQLTSLNFIHTASVINLDQSDFGGNIESLEDSIPTISQRPYLCYTVNQCITLRKSITSNVEPDLSAVDNKDGTDMSVFAVDISDGKTGIDQKVQIIQGNHVNIILSPAQMKIVTALKDSIEGGQLLGYLQGFPGAGKTTTAKKMEEATGLRVLYCGSTGTASAHFKSKTINSLLSLGLSIDNIDLASETTSPQIITKIVQLMDEYHLLLVDEASMLTPVTLARIDLRMRHCFDPNLPFGGKHILLCGDMWQFPPVSGLSKPALYQSAVVIATNKRVPNEAYRAGANLFTQFKLFVLNDQQRCEPDYADFLKPLRDMKIKYPITKE